MFSLFEKKQQQTDCEGLFQIDTRIYNYNYIMYNVYDLYI